MDEIINQICEQVLWSYDIGHIETINTDSVCEVIEEYFPDVVMDQNLIFQVMMKL